MKTIFILSIATLLAACGPTNKVSNDCYKGRLEIKAICSNYTIKLLEGDVDPDSIAASWTDEQTGKTYTNVFSLVNPCALPANFEEGQEFYFTIVQDTGRNDCVTCMAYYPKPEKKLNIRILSEPCR